MCKWDTVQCLWLNPQFHEMVSAINKAPPGYKAPSSEKARTVLLDECARDVKRLTINPRHMVYTRSFYCIPGKRLKRGKMVVKFFLNHTQALAIFRDNSKLELLKVAQTRFASHYILLKRLKDCREALATTVVLNSWREWAKQGDENKKKAGELVVQTIQSESFWINVDHILAVTKPIFSLIKFCDGDGPRMGEIYERMNNMVGEIKDVMKDNIFGEFYPEVEKIILARWDKMTIPLHCLGFALTPRFYDTRYIEALAPGGQQRRAPNLDKEVMTGVIDAFERIAENQEEDDLLRKQFGNLFSHKKGPPLHNNGLDSYKEGPLKKWDMNPESTNLEGSTSRLEDMQWENLDKE
ncbi:putative hAT dimerization domain, ribonuclease H-like superfamily protein [Tanacetum coccineum]|uniref:HAT dimerization domain, ribonuclease H-like superfamily protein n=1 Tax=Tanacetum coccineum TaxID=301880 RepID=A0ABQ5BFT8_9ASTR